MRWQFFVIAFGVAFLFAALLPFLLPESKSDPKKDKGENPPSFFPETRNEVFETEEMTEETVDALPETMPQTQEAGGIFPEPTLPGNEPSDDTPGGGTSGGSTSSGGSSSSNTSGGGASSGNTSGGSTSGGNTSGGGTSGSTSGGSTSGGSTSGGNTSGGGTSGSTSGGGSSSSGSGTSNNNNIKGGSTGDCFWELDGTVLTISGNGRMDDYTEVTSPWGEEITRVVIEEGVTYIGTWAFSYIPLQGTLNIPASVTEIGSCAFFGNDFSAIRVASKNTVYHADGNCLIKTKEKKLTLACKNSVIPNDGSVTSIGTGSYGRLEIEEIILPDSVTKIESAMGEECTVKKIVMGKGLKTIEEDAFAMMACIEEFHIASLSQWLGIDFGYQLDYYPRKLDLYVGSALLTDLVIPDGMTKIPDYAFEICTSIKTVTIPKSVTHIGTGAFLDCPNLSDVYYEGSKADLRIGGENFALNSGVTWHYNVKLN